MQWLHNEFAFSLDELTVGHELKKLSYVKLVAGPRHHPQPVLAIYFKELAGPASAVMASRSRPPRSGG